MILEHITAPLKLLPAEQQHRHWSSIDSDNYSQHRIEKKKAEAYWAKVWEEMQVIVNKLNLSISLTTGMIGEFETPSDYFKNVFNVSLNIFINDLTL